MSRLHILFFTVSILLWSLVSCAGTQKIRIEKLDDLPRYTYTLDVKAAELFENDEDLNKLMEAVKRDLESDLRTYEIDDKTTLQGYYANLGTIALLENRYNDYLDYLERRVQLEEKVALQLTKGHVARAYVKAVKSGDRDVKSAFRREYSAFINQLPYKTVEAVIRQSKGSAEITSKNLILGIIESRIQPVLDESNGEMSKDIATTLLAYNYNVRYYLPYKDIVIDVLSSYIDANKVEKPNIWTERDVVLSADDEGSPVTVAIWDSGVDTDIYTGNLWHNEKEVGDNGVDDDGNGFVDDIFGVAYTLKAEKTPELLYPIGDMESDRARLQRQMKGLRDITAAVESEEASELKKLLSNMQQEEVKPFIEDIGKYGNYAHGTHVAGIAARGNPLIRIMTARITFSFTMIPPEPTVKQARKDSTMMREVVDYFSRNGVRVVNMSWGENLSYIEDALEANNAGGMPEERQALAREIFEIFKGGLYSAIKEAPEILFITSAGNADSDVTFEEFIPSSFDLPNIMSIGAVDQAGDETSFTSFGKVDVYANGFEVASYVPGGDEMELSGTSMSSPNVVNLAAKLIAIRPELTPQQVWGLITGGVDVKAAGERKIQLINPKKSMELLTVTK